MPRLEYYCSMYSRDQMKSLSQIDQRHIQTDYHRYMQGLMITDRSKIHTQTKDYRKITDTYTDFRSHTQNEDYREITDIYTDGQKRND